MIKHQVVIIGAGPAGISAAIWSSRLGLSALVLEKRDMVGGQLENIQNEIVDYPGFPSITGKDLQKVFHQHIQSTTVETRLLTEVSAIDGKRKIVHTPLGEIGYEFLIVATGAKEKQLGVPGEHLLTLQKLSATRDKDRFDGKHVVVIGGGDRACEGAFLLADAGAHVVLLHRSDDFRARHEFWNKVEKHPNISIRTFVAVKRILGDEKPEGIEVYDVRHPEDMEYIQADGIFVRIGTRPNSALLKGIVSMNENGYCFVDTFGQTSLPNVFCIGDLQVQPNASSIAVAVAQGMLAAKRISMLFEEEKKRV